MVGSWNKAQRTGSPGGLELSFDIVWWVDVGRSVPPESPPMNQETGWFLLRMQQSYKSSGKPERKL